MLVLSLFSILSVVALQPHVTATLATRMASLSLLAAAALSFNPLDATFLGTGVPLFSGLYQATTLSLSAECLIASAACVALLPWSPNLSQPVLPLDVPSGHSGTTSTVAPVVEYGLLAIFSAVGAMLLVSSADLVSVYLGIELQSFAVYVLAAVYRDSLGATAAGLKYFLLGGLSSCFILLGAALIYSATGLTSLDGLYALLSVGDLMDVGLSSCGLGVVLLTCGLLFKVASAPFHNWAPDVYDGVPTIVTTWLAVLPKLSILALLLELTTGLGLNGLTVSGYDVLRGIFLLCSLLSLLVGTVVGLSQWRIKRLLSYSTISHIGFMLLALSVTGSESTTAFTFYVAQYTFTALTAFLVLLSLGYASAGRLDVESFSDLKGRFASQPLLVLSLSVCVLSMAGVPPLLGFFGKLSVLSATVQGGNFFMALVAIVVSVVSASYYLKVVRVGHFEAATVDVTAAPDLSPVHSYLIATMTLCMVFFVAKPSLVLNSFSVLALAFGSA